MLRTLFSFRDRYRILHLTWFAFFLSFVVWFDVAPFATTIQRELHLTSPQLKILAICNLALTIPARILIGMVLDRYGPRLTFSALLMFAVVPCWLTATAHDFNQLVWSSLINGVAEFRYDLPPSPPNFGGNPASKSPKIGGFRGQSQEYYYNIHTLIQQRPFFLQEPQSSVATNSPETAIASTK